MFTNSPAEKREKSEDTPHNYSGRMMVNLLLIRPYFRGEGCRLFHGVACGGTLRFRMIQLDSAQPSPCI